MRVLTEKEVADLLLENAGGCSLTFLKQGQTPPRTDKGLLFEAEYFGAGHSEMVALDRAHRTFMRAHLGENIYTRGITITETEHETGKGFLCVITAALRPFQVSSGTAIDLLNRGMHAKRQHWNGANQYVYQQRFEGFRPTYAISLPGGEKQLGWVPSMGDLIASDWEILDPNRPKN